ncbi:MAG: DUF58 domain-containing protein [Oscillospiraceae bacterium]|nr:DUF58 domain-containing protein [Oscillospiraceae bacterium]
MFVLTILLAPIDLIVSLPGMLTKSMLLYVPTVLEKDENAVLKLITTHTKSYPVRCIIAKVRLSGDDFSAKYKLICSPEKDIIREIAIDTSHSGVAVFELKRIWAVSLLGLFSLPVSINAKQSMLILPPPIKPLNAVALQHGTQLRPKPGGGFSEEHDMREYRHGDPIKSIHWKISAKYDKPIIREPLVPPPHSRLVHVVPWKNTAQRDLILGRLRWVSSYLLKRNMPFYLRLSNGSEIVEVMQEEDLTNFICFAFGDNTIKINKSDRLPSRFSWVFRIDAADNRG